MTKLLAFTAAALLSSFAFAQEQSPPPGETAAPPATAPEPQPQQTGSIFDALDTNQDGNLAQAEAQAHPTVAQHFAQADANGDGALSREEFSAAFQSQ